MTAKRFQWVFIKDNELELRDNGIVKRFNNERLEELLNELHETNEQLQHDATILIQANQDYRKENESLKEENKFLRNKVATYKKGNALLKKTLDKEWK